jgi:O-succinylbenzoate synthase
MGALRDALPDALLQADANGSLEGADGRSELLTMDQLGLSCIEEPVSGFDLAAAWALSQELETPVCLDESLSSHRAVRDAIKYGACRAFCIKPGRLGGIRAALRSLDEIAGAGMAAFIGGMHETGLGRAANGVLSLHPACSLVSDVVAPSTYLDVDPCGLPGPSGGFQPLYVGPGIGPWPDRALVGSI